MNTELFEAAGPFYNLPHHWINYLVSRYGKEYSFEGAGEQSEIVPIKGFEPNKIKKLLKDSNMMAIIGRIKGDPLFMISAHDSYNNKYHIFEVQKGEGGYDSKGVRSYAGRRSRRSKVADSYNLNEMVDIVDQLFQKAGGDFSGLTMTAISKDQERQKLIDKRRGYKQLPDDPLKQEKPGYGYRVPPSESQKKRVKAYAEIQRKKLDVVVEKEKEKIKQQINIVLDDSLKEVIENIKKGRTYEISKEKIGKTLVNAIDISGIQRLTQAYNALDTNYSSKHPLEVVKELKKLNIK